MKKNKNKLFGHQKYILPQFRCSLIIFVHIACLLFVFQAFSGVEDVKKCSIDSNQNYKKMKQLSGYQAVEIKSTAEKEKQLNEMTKELENPNFSKIFKIGFLKYTYQMTEQISFLSINILVETYCKKQNQELLVQIEKQMETHLTTFNNPP